jgi:hypothetical protein
VSSTSRSSLLFSPVAPRRALAATALLCCAAADAAAQATQNPPPSAQSSAALSDPAAAQRLERLERENDELRRRMDLLAGEVERFSLGEIVPPVGASEHGLGPAASKVYGVQQGLSIGGYGEGLYQNFDSDNDSGGDAGKSDEADFLRGVLYFGYKFDERWVLNTEIEIEHADEIFLEFAYLDYLASPSLNLRGGLVLAPMGFLNEMHEPTTFLSARRPGVETVIIPSTWRENGVGVHGELGDFVYRSYIMNGFNGEGFTAGGLRGGRQKGSQALAEDIAWTGRVDWVGVPGLTLGASAYFGDSGQDKIAGADVGTSIVEAHVEWKWRGWHARALAAQAELDDVAELNALKGVVGDDSVGERLDGWYAELGYDLMALIAPSSSQSLTPFVRFETYDTQAEVPTGFASDPANDVDVTTIGVAWKPIEQLVFKLDYQDVDNEADTGVDQFNVALGYVF